MALYTNSKTQTKNEQGFTLVEILVVILVIGILAAVAIPAFLEQRQKANDAAVESDARNVALMVETWLTDNPNEKVPYVTGWSTDTISVGSGEDMLTTELSDGVHMVVRHPQKDPGPGGSTFEDGEDTTIPPGVYEIEGAHINGDRYRTDGGSYMRYYYRSDMGGDRSYETWD